MESISDLVARYRWLPAAVTAAAVLLLVWVSHSTAPADDEETPAPEPKPAAPPRTKRGKYAKKQKPAAPPVAAPVGEVLSVIPGTFTGSTPQPRSPIVAKS